MISFNPAVVGFVLSAFALSQCSAAEDSIRARRLSYPIIAGYEPQTLVTDTVSACTVNVLCVAVDFPAD